MKHTFKTRIHIDTNFNPSSHIISKITVATWVGIDISQVLHSVNHGGACIYPKMTLRCFLLPHLIWQPLSSQLFVISLLNKTIITVKEQLPDTSLASVAFSFKRSLYQLFGIILAFWMLKDPVMTELIKSSCFKSAVVWEMVTWGDSSR